MFAGMLDEELKGRYLAPFIPNGCVVRLVETFRVERRDLTPCGGREVRVQYQRPMRRKHHDGNRS